MIAIQDVSTFSKIPGFVPFGVLYYTADTGDLYIGTGSSIGPAVNAISSGVSSIADTVLQTSSTQGLSLPTLGNLYVEGTAGSGGITLTLPTAVGNGGSRITIIQVDTGAGGVTITTTNSQHINGASSYELTNQYQTVTLESNGANWRVVATAN